MSSHRIEISRIIMSSRTYQTAIRVIRRHGDTTDKTRAFRRDVLNAISADKFERVEFAGVKKFYNRDTLLEECIRISRPELSEWVELGVGSGQSAKVILETASRLGRTARLHGFDSFQGLPEAWAEIAAAGTYSYPAPRLQDGRVVLHPGWFEETLPSFGQSCTEQLGFVHVDCDLYSSTATAFRALGHVLRPGTVLLFDEYWNYLEAAEHEQRALRELLDVSGLSFRYVGYNVDYMQAAVVLTE